MAIKKVVKTNDEVENIQLNKVEEIVEIDEVQEEKNLISISKEDLSKLITEELDKFKSSLTQKEVKQEVKEEIKYKSYKDDPEYQSIINDMKFKQKADLDNKKSELKEIFGLEDEDLNLNSIEELVKFEKVLKKSMKKVAKSAVNNESVAQYLKSDKAILNNIKASVFESEPVNKFDADKVTDKFLSFFQNKKK